MVAHPRPVINEAPCSKLQGIKRNCAEANPPSLYELRRGRLAIHPCSKLQGILAKANKRIRSQFVPLSPFAFCRNRDN
jgi:hypothetical protein